MWLWTKDEFVFHQMWKISSNVVNVFSSIGRNVASGFPMCASWCHGTLTGALQNVLGGSPICPPVVAILDLARFYKIQDGGTKSHRIWARPCWISQHCIRFGFHEVLWDLKWRFMAEPWRRGHGCAVTQVSLGTTDLAEDMATQVAGPCLKLQRTAFRQQRYWHR